ncbi:hypothetical protein BGW80DRAFT_285715 [Lactifluus volemus]|nr:hypothetical protein BGW80DRAFT_285715 [Lactifluus volemus]
MFPFENLAARYITRGHDGANEIVWLVVLLQLSSICITDIGFSSVFVFVAAAAPNKRSLGATNGLPKTVVAFQFIVGPAPPHRCLRSRSQVMSLVGIFSMSCSSHSSVSRSASQLRRLSCRGTHGSTGMASNLAVARIPSNPVFQICESHIVILLLRYCGI